MVSRFARLALLSFGSIAAAQDGGTGVLTKAPTLVQQVEPTFPPELADAGVGGDVTLEIDIGPDGKVLAVNVTQSAGEAFDRSATEAVKQFVFTPAEIDFQPASVRISFTLHFVYKPPPEPEVVQVDAGMSSFSGVVRCDTLISNSVVSASYTPGAGNIW